jgi:hypothetical protein
MGASVTIVRLPQIVQNGPPTAASMTTNKTMGANPGQLEGGTYENGEHFHLRSTSSSIGKSETEMTGVQSYLSITWHRRESPCQVDGER